MCIGRSLEGAQGRRGAAQHSSLVVKAAVQHKAVQASGVGRCFWQARGQASQLVIKEGASPACTAAVNGELPLELGRHGPCAAPVSKSGAAAQLHTVQTGEAPQHAQHQPAAVTSKVQLVNVCWQHSQHGCQGQGLHAGRARNVQGE